MQSYPTPIEIVKKEVLGPHFTKYHLGGGKVLHHFTRAEDYFYHDHPWAFRTTILSGGYVEEVAVITENGTLALATMERLPGTTHDVQADTIHKLTRLLAGDCWTLVEPRQTQQKWGFYKCDESGVWHRYHDQSEWSLLVAVPAELV